MKNLFFFSWTGKASLSCGPGEEIIKKGPTIRIACVAEVHESGINLKYSRENNPTQNSYDDMRQRGRVVRAPELKNLEISSSGLALTTSWICSR